MNFILQILTLLVLLIVCYANNLYEFQAESITGDKIDMSAYSNAKVVLIVNVASNCGFTYTNYQQMMELYDKYHHRGLEILAFPCNQFGEQEPGTNADIQLFTRNFGVTFPVFSKIEVNGPNAHPIYKFLKSMTDNMELGWNFVKFLIVDGFPVKRYASRVAPRSIEQDILQYLDPDRGDESL